MTTTNKEYFKDKTSIILTRENRNKLMEIKLGMDFSNVNQVISFLLETHEDNQTRDVECHLKNNYKHCKKNFIFW